MARRAPEEAGTVLRRPCQDGFFPPVGRGHFRGESRPAHPGVVGFQYVNVGDVAIASGGNWRPIEARLRHVFLRRLR